jgi:hypothetical protein
MLLQDVLDYKFYEGEPEWARDPELASLLRKMYGDEYMNSKSFDYVIAEDGNIWLGVAEDARQYHSDVALGKNVYGAGEIRIDWRTGEIVRIDDWSGHYGPQIDKFAPYMQHLMDDLGIQYSDRVFKFNWEGRQ